MHVLIDLISRRLRVSKLLLEMRAAAEAEAALLVERGGAPAEAAGTGAGTVASDVGGIGGTLAGRLTTLGHDVRIANSRGPQTLKDVAARTGAKAVTPEDGAICRLFPAPFVPVSSFAVARAKVTVPVWAAAE